MSSTIKPQGLLTEDDLTDLRTAPPVLGPRLLMRQDLVDRLHSVGPSTIVALIAPAGYGKSTLLTQFAEDRAGPTAWLSISRFDNDSLSLLTHVASALSRSGALGDWSPPPMRPGVATIVGSTASLARAVAETSDDAVLILDRIELLTNRGAKDTLHELIERLQGHATVILSSRSSARLPLSALRAGGHLLELTEKDLALTHLEAEMLLDDMGIGSERAAAIIEECEGWPAALYLMALTEKDLGPDVVEDEAGSRFLVDYLADEVVRTLPRGQHEFLTKTSILDQLSGPLCDAVLQTTGSGRMLRKLESSTHLIHAVDSSGTWYRANRIFRSVLNSELEHDGAEPIHDLHQRAADWYEAQLMPLPALDHLRRGDNSDAFARLLGDVMRIRYTSGYSAAVVEWMDWMEGAGILSGHPEIAAVGSLILALQGQALRAERWLEVACAGDQDTPPLVELVRGLGARDGIEDCINGALAARASFEAGSVWLPATYLVEGLGHMWSGDPASAEPPFAEAVTTGIASQSYIAVTLALAERALIAINSGDWALGKELVHESIDLIEDSALEGYVTSAIAYVVSARIARRDGDVTRAETMLAHAAHLRPMLNSSIPGLAVQASVEMAKGYAELSDVVGARAVMRDAADTLLQRPNLGVLPDQLEELRRALKNLGPGTIGPSSLTKAELRLLPYLATHLSFPEIGDRLFISRHTVKTQAMSIYRKLGASSRSEAVSVAIDAGMLTA